MSGLPMNEVVFQIKIKLKIGEKVIELNAFRTYNELRNELLSKHGISASSIIKYLDDFDEAVAITNQDTYMDSLRCCNGQFHYMSIDRIIKQASNENVIVDIVPTIWKCIRCHHENKPELAKCAICDFRKTQ